MSLQEKPQQWIDLCADYPIVPSGRRTIWAVRWLNHTAQTARIPDQRPGAGASSVRTGSTRSCSSAACVSVSRSVFVIGVV